MVQTKASWVQKNACPTDLAGGQCISDDEILTHHTPERGQYANAPRLSVLEDEISLIRGEIGIKEACSRRIGGGMPAPTDVAKAGVRYARAGDLRGAGFAVIHTCTRKGEDYGHVSAVWPDADPLNQQEKTWPPYVQKAFAACFTEQEA
jgi:hypothetical protein